MKNKEKVSYSKGKSIIVLVTSAGTIKSACNYELANNDPSFLNIGTSVAFD